MAGNIKEEIIQSFQTGTTLTKLIYINLGVFVVINLLLVMMRLFNGNILWFNALMLPAQVSEFAKQPWSILTYMFLHEGFIHLLFNILTLYWMGNLFLQYATQHSLVGIYILGGLVGGLAYMLGINFFPLFANSGISAFHLLGASASVMAVTVATAVFAPERPIRMFMFGEVKLKWIAIAFIIISLLQMSAENAGGQMAHIGGAIAGFFFAQQYLKGKDITEWVSKLLNSAVNFFRKFDGKPKMKATYKRTESDQDYNYRKKQENENIDRILDKIKSSGYESLSDDERKQLFGNNK